MKNLRKILFASGIATGLLVGQTSEQVNAKNCDAYIKNYTIKENLAINYLEKNSGPDYSILEKSHDSLMAKVKSFVGMTHSEINSRKKRTENYTRGLDLDHEGSVKSYIEQCQKDSAYVKSVLNKADSLKLFLEIHIKNIENAMTIDFKKSRENFYKAVAEFKVAKDTLSEKAKQQRKSELEKIDNQLEDDEALLKALKEQSENYLGEIKEYVAKVPNSILESYVSELIKSRKILADLQKKEKKKQEKAKNKK